MSHVPPLHFCDRRRNSLTSHATRSSVPQGKSDKPCPPVAPKSPQEALMMEAASNKKGCWIRDKRTGLLGFVSDVPPNKNYKPILETPKTSTSGCNPQLKGHGEPSGNKDLAGTWEVKLGVYPGEGELGIIRMGQHLGGSKDDTQIINGCQATDVKTERTTI